MANTPTSSNAIQVGVPQRLADFRGVVVRQKLQYREALAQTYGLSYEAANKYRISALPYNKVVKNRPDDPDGWEPATDELDVLEPFLFVHEQSSKCTRLCFTWMGCSQVRPLKLHFAVSGARGDVYLIDRPFRCCGGLTCSPFEMSVSDAAGVHGPRGRHLGRVREDFAPYLSRCFATCCLATTYTDIERALPDGTYEKRYSLRTNRSCCGRVNNCCGATCCKNDAVYDILDVDGEVVAHLQRTYGGSADWTEACFRMNYGFNNFVLEFPPDSTSEDRVLLISALFQVEYQHFEGKE